MDRGGRTEPSMAGEPDGVSVAAGASARVAEILEEAEQHGRELNQQAERDAAAARSDAEAEAQRILAEARESALEAARERSRRLAELQSALASRGPAVLEGLEGAGITRARLEALIDALAASAERIVAEADAQEPADAAASEGPAASEEPETAEPEAAAPEPDPPAASETDAATDEPETAAGEGEGSNPEEDPVAAAEELAKPLDDEGEGALDSNGDGGIPTPFNGSLPEGAPLARMPLRSPERDARFAALLLAVQGRERGDVEAHLREEYGFADCEPILDEVFGRATA